MSRSMFTVLPLLELLFKNQFRGLGGEDKKLNTDGSVIDNSSMAGCGGVVRDEEGN